MKKLLLMTIALLALGATMAAAADNIDLEWGSACRSAANNTSAALNNVNTQNIGGVPCNDSSDPMLAAPTRTLTSQFTPGTALPDFSGTTIQIEMTSPAGFAAGSIWDFQGTGCNPGAFAPKATVGTVNGCTNPFAGDPQGQGNAFNVIWTNTKITFQQNRVRNTTITPLTAGTVYVADQSVLDLDSSGQTQLCPGCTQTVDFFLTFVKYFSPGTEIKAETPGLRAGGPCIGFNDAAPTCGGATPTQRSTWGSVKALYR